MPPAPTVDLTPLVKVVEALAATTQAMTERTRQLTRLIHEGREGYSQVTIHRDSKGNMETLIVERILPEGNP